MIRLLTNLYCISNPTNKIISPDINALLDIKFQNLETKDFIGFSLIFVGFLLILFSLIKFVLSLFKRTKSLS